MPSFRRQNGCVRLIRCAALLWCGAAGLVSTAAVAEDNAPQTRGRYYVGIGAGVYDAEVEGRAAGRAVFGRYFIGRRLDDYFAIEIALSRYKDIGRINGDTTVEQSSQAHTWVGDVSLGPSYPLTKRLDLYARLGWSLQHTSVDGPDSASTSNQPVASLGLTLGVYEDAPLRLEYSHLKGNHAVRDVKQLSLQILHVFF